MRLHRATPPMLRLAIQLLAFVMMASAVTLAIAQDEIEYESIPAPATSAPIAPGTLPNTIVVDPQAMDGGYDAFAPIDVDPMRQALRECRGASPIHLPDSKTRPTRIAPLRLTRATSPLGACSSFPTV